jgi:hypothetical protein
VKSVNGNARSALETSRIGALAASPALFGMMVVLVYLLALVPTLYRHHGDISTLIVAGDKFVAAGRTPSPIIVRPHSAGYDGQFYYKIALHPFATAPIADGVTFDHAAWRLQRIAYPLVSHIVALGQARFIPAALLATNIAALFALSWLAMRFARRHPATTIAAWPLILWPGFMVALTHDTTELLTCALLLGAICAYLDEQYLLFACAGALAALTRETCSLMLAGIALTELLRILRKSASSTPRPIPRAWRPLGCAALALVPFAIWHIWVALHVHDAGQTAPVQANIDLPLVGVTQRLIGALSTTLAIGGVPAKARLMSLYTAATAVFIIVFSMAVLGALPKLWRHGGRVAALATGLLAMMILLSLLSARGPWIDPTAVFRAFSEAWVVGWVLLILAGRPIGRAAWFALVPLALMNWSICMTQLR